jgi:hypothetical protein
MDMGLRLHAVSPSFLISAVETKPSQAISIDHRALASWLAVTTPTKKTNLTPFSQTLFNSLGVLVEH